MAQDAPRYLGIDLGTTNTAAAVFDGEAVQLVRTSDGGTLTPSVVRIDAKGRVTVGARARRFLDTDPENTRGEFKRLMGTDRPLRFPAAGVDRRPEELAAEVLRSVRADVRDLLGFEPARAIVSVPALFELPQSAATSEAARLAGFERVELIQEPVASALAAGWTAEDDGGGAWLVYDMGGGTFDASLLETRDGLLRVVGHDGDNFLGGRDLDRAIVDHVLERINREGAGVDRQDPAHAVALRRLRLAAEEAKIDLTRRDEAEIALPGLFVVRGEPVDVELALRRSELEGLLAPLVDRSLAVCRRLLARHGLGAEALRRVVLVGGPTVVPALRERVAATLGAPITDGLDPMTLVAHGAALYAATAGLDARPGRAAEAATGRRLWLQYPAMSADLSPFVAGRLLPGPGPAPTEARLVREDGGFATEWVRLGADGGVVFMVELQPRRPNGFRLEGRDDEGRPVALAPPGLSIVQGLTLGDPPLSRSVGVALADDTVQVYLERGTPLPAKRTFVHRTVQAVPQGATDIVLSVPIVQGELEEAHLCRLVGRLQIGGTALPATLPAGSDVEVTLEVDRGGRLSARALVPRLQQVFEEVARLVTPDADPAALAEQLGPLRLRLAEARSRAGRAGDPQLLDRLFDVEWSLQDASSSIDAARGGDEDAGQKARRALIDADAALEELEGALAWPELDASAMTRIAWASGWVSQQGTAQEQRLLDEATQGVERARAARKGPELQRQLRVVTQLGQAAFYRHPDAWRWAFDGAASRVSEASDPARALELVQQGREAAASDDRSRLREIVQRLWDLLPGDPASPDRGYGSGLR